MFIGNLNEEQFNGLVRVLEQSQEIIPEYLRHDDSLNTITLTWFQCMSVEHALISKGSLCSMGTGLGKTAVSASYVKENLILEEGSKALFFCLPESVEQVVSDYNDYLDLNIIGLTGQQADMNYMRSLDEEEWDVAIISYRALYNYQFANWYLENMDDICCAVFDEVHELSQDSIINSIATILCKMLPSKLFLSATPITVSPTQVITLLNMLDDRFIPQGDKLLKPYEIRDKETYELIDYKPLDEISNRFYMRYISWTRSELGLSGNYRPHLLLIEPTEEQIECAYKDITTKIKGVKESNQIETLKAIVSDMKVRNKTGLIYCDTRANSEMLKEVLSGEGHRTMIANGVKRNRDIRGAILKLFSQKELDVLITNLTTSLNLDCDYLIFWENTNRAVQMLGRCERGFTIKDLDIYFLLTENTVEVSQFSRNVYRRCKWLGEALSKDVSTFTEVQRALEKYDSNYDV